MTAKEQKLGYDSGSVSTLDKVKRFASRNGALIGLSFVHRCCSGHPYRCAVPRPVAR